MLSQILNINQSNVFLD